MTCRFCGPEWESHDPLKMAGVKTSVGEWRHARRGLDVAVTREILLPLLDFTRRILDTLHSYRVR